MKILSLYFTIISALCITLGVKGRKIDSDTRHFLNTLRPILDINQNTPFNLAFAAVANINDTIKNYEDVYNKSTDECMRGIYSYCIHMLEISHNLQCNSKFHSINDEYKNNKPCYKVNQDMQNILDHGNAYLDLFCARDDKAACPFVTEIVKIQNDTTILQNACSDPKNRTKCDETLINNYSIMIDAAAKINGKNVTYTSGGNTITLTTPQYNLTKIEADMKNKTCVIDIQPPKQILVNINSTKKNVTSKAEESKESSEAILGQKMNTVLILVTVTLIALLF